MRLVARVGLLAAVTFVAACSTPPPIVEKPLPPERQIPAGAAKALTEWFPDLHVVANSSGPLQKPDINDIAVVLARGDASGDFVIALLEPNGHDDYRVVTASKPIHPGCPQCSVGVDLARHGLYVHVIRAAGDEDYENFTYQFAWRDGEDALTMIGVTAYIPSRADDPIPHSFSASVDMLTGKRTDIIDESQNDEPVHRERQTSVPVRPPITFDAFAFTADALDVETRQLPPVAFDPAGTLPAAAVDALRERFPQMTVQSQASGSLRGDGSRDIVAVLAPADRNARSGAAADALVAVLLGQADGSVRLAEVSGAMAHDCPTCDVQVQIARRTLRVQTTDVKATGSVSTDWQFAFKPKDAPMRLVGLRTETTERSAANANRRTVASTNLINGDHVETIDGVVNGHRSHNEQKTRLAPAAPVLLSDFGFDPAALLDDAPTAAGPRAPVTTAAESISGS